MTTTTAQKDFTLTAEQFEKLDSMIRGITFKYRDWYRMSWEDLQQECWIKACETIKTNGFEPNLIAKNCYHLISDINRKNKRRMNQFPTYDSEIFSEESNLPVKDPDEQAWSAKNTLAQDFTSQVFIKEMDALFEDGSQEKKLFRLMAIYVGAVRPNQNLFGVFFEGVGSMEKEIAKKLGYNSNSNCGYRNLRKRVRKTIEKYMKSEKQMSF